MDDKPLGLGEAAHSLGLGYERTRQLVRAGVIAASRPGGSRGSYQIERSEISRIKRETSTRKAGQ